jgi:fructokinase
VPDLSDAGEGNIHVFSSSTRNPFIKEWLPLARAQFNKGINIYDVNIRASSFDDKDFIFRLEKWLHLADVIKVSVQDMNAILERFYSGQGMDVQKLAQQWMQLGAKMVVITNGAEGATACTPDGKYFSVPAKPGKFNNTLGAGDGYDAGLAMGLAAQQRYSADAVANMSRQNIEQLLGYADGVASQYLKGRNANPPVPQLQNQPRPS